MITVGILVSCIVAVIILKAATGSADGSALTINAGMLLASEGLDVCLQCRDVLPDGVNVWLQVRLEVVADVG